MLSFVVILVITVVNAIGIVSFAQESEKPTAKDAALASVGKETREAREIKITADETIVGTRTFDEATTVEVAADAQFIKGTDGKLIFKRLPKAPRSQVFQGFSPGDVVIETGCSASGDVVPPEWWGAVGTDSPASAAANVAAIHAALAAVVRSPLAVSLNGVYCVDDKIRLQSGSRLTVAEHGAIKAIPNIALPPGDYLVEIKGQSDVTIDGIEVDGNRIHQTQDAAHAYGGIIAVNSNRCTITKCKVHDCNGPLTGGAVGNGIRTHMATDITISDNDIYSNNGCGINIYNTSTRIHAINNTIRNNREIGIESEGRGENYTDFRNKAIIITGNDIVGSTETGRLCDHSILVDWTDDSTITKNRCHNSTHNGIEILGSRNVQIVENDCAKNGDIGPPYTWASVRVTAEGFGEDGRSSHVTIRNNRVVGSQYGIYLDTVDHVVINANKITDVIHGSLVVGPRTNDIDVSGNVLGTVGK